MQHLSSQEIKALAGRVIDAESRAVAAASASIDDAFVQVAQLLVQCQGKIVVVGSGTNGAVARRASHLLSVGGMPSFSLSPSDGLHGGLGVLRPADIVVALSKGGGSQELNDFCRRARSLCGALVGFTARADSELATLVDHVVLLRMADDADLGGVIATGSTLTTSALLDALVEIGRVARGYSWKDLLYTHPAGAVGHDAEQSLGRLGTSSETM